MLSDTNETDEEGWVWWGGRALGFIQPSDWTDYPLTLQPVWAQAAVNTSQSKPEFSGRFVEPLWGHDLGWGLEPTVVLPSDQRTTHTNGRVIADSFQAQGSEWTDAVTMNWWRTRRGAVLFIVHYVWIQNSEVISSEPSGAHQAPVHPGLQRLPQILPDFSIFSNIFHSLIHASLVLIASFH